MKIIATFIVSRKSVKINFRTFRVMSSARRRSKLKRLRNSQIKSDRDHICFMRVALLLQLTNLWPSDLDRIGGRTGTNNKLNPHMTPSPGIKPEPHWWEVSALTTVPSLLPNYLSVVLNLVILC